MIFRNIYTLLLALTAVATISSCQKDEDDLNVDLSEYNLDTYVPTEADTWIKANLSDPYNIQVVYRFDRNLTDASRDISPVRYEKVIPTAQMVLDGFLKVYEKVGGATFIKQNTPKQFVFYGSESYNSNGSVTLGTAEGGRKIVLYDLNNLDFSNSTNVKRRLRTIHHEFTHIVNQLVAIPPAFEQITKADYYTDWTDNTGNPESVSRSLGFISRYARSSYVEDFAETSAHLLVEGQLWYDSYAKNSGTDAYNKLKQKEALVVDYFKQYFNIDFRQLQYEVQRVLRENYNDNTGGFAYWLAQGAFSTLEMNPTQDHYAKYGTSASFQTVWQAAVTALAAVGNAGRRLNYMNLLFLDATNLEIVLGYNNTAGTNYIAYFSFTMNVNTTTGETTFTRIAQRGTTTSYTNANVIAAGFEPLSTYFTTHSFVADWLPENVTIADLYKFGGFYVAGDPGNYFYGTLPR